MDNFDRRVRYAAANRGWRADQAAILLPHYIQAGVEDLLVRPGAQARRIRKHRFDNTEERQQRREAAELKRNRRRLWLWDVLTPRTSKVVLRDIRTGTNAAPLDIPWAQPDARVRDDLAAVGVTSETTFGGDATAEMGQALHDEITAMFGPPGAEVTPPGGSMMRSAGFDATRLAGRGNGKTSRTQPRRNTRAGRQHFQRKAG